VIWTIAPDSSATVIDIGQIDGRRMFGRGLNNHGEAPATQIGMLMDQVDRLDLGRIGRGLNRQLTVALEKLEDSKPQVAEKLLKVFAFEVKLLERLRRLDAVETDSLLAIVNDVLATLDE
jgi:hypothetical protein